MLVPSKIIVTNEFPKEKNEDYNLAYYVVTPDPVHEGTMRRILMELSQSYDPRYAGMNCDSYYLNSLRLHRLNDAERDKLYGLGYNPVMSMPGHANVIWDQHVGRSPVLVPHLMELLDIFVMVAKKVAVLSAEDPRIRFHYIMDAIGHDFQCRVARRAAFHDIQWRNIDNAAQMYIELIPVWHQNVQFILNLVGSEAAVVHWWTCANPDAKEYMKAMVGCYPNLCRKIPYSSTQYSMMDTIVEAY
jgi:hypothetical protein